jgi:AraC family transcriptional regulator
MPILSLQKGRYLGRRNQSFHSDTLIATITSYPISIDAESLHYHETFVTSLVLTGGNLEKRRNREIERTPGVVTYHDVGDLHRNTRILPDSRHVNLEVTEKFFSQYGLTGNATALEKHNPADARFLMLKIYRELLINDTDSFISIESAVLHLFKIVERLTISSVPPRWTSRVKEALYDRWEERVTLDELALIANLHPANLSGYFPRFFGCTLGEYRRKIKAEKALELIRTSELSLTEIAYRCGFADQSHFSRTFKQLTGWTPKKLQEAYHK